MKQNIILDKNRSVNPNHIIYGIQGGKGSFNEEAVDYYMSRHKNSKFKIKYLHTTERVLKALDKGDIDYGQFAIHNSVGGIVQESLVAISKHRFHIVEQFPIIISHTLMIRSDTDFADIDTIMTHPQVLAQCKNTISKNYPKYKLFSGEGKLIDHALVAKMLYEKKLSKNIATIGSQILAEIYNLRVIENDLQDSKNNYTSFLVVQKK